MTFKERKKQSYVLFKGWIAFSVIEFEIFDDVIFDGQILIDQFIKSPQDFEFARKYIGGYDSDHTDEFGQRTFSKVYNFGPYPIELLELEDYVEKQLYEFENISFKMLSEIPANRENDFEYLKFITNVKSEFKSLKTSNSNFYQLLPPNWKLDELSTFTLDNYLCGFSIDWVNKTLVVLQIDND